MKTLTKSLMLAAVAATALVSCTKENDNPVENVKKGTHVEFSAQIVGEASSTKATLTTTDDKDFAAAWVHGTDLIGLYAYDGNSFDETAPATWNESKETFEADFQTAAPTVAGAWMYEATYPYDADGNIPFGSPRVQNGNAYNSAYDIMYGAVDYDNALLGKDNTGANFVIPMNRLTGIAYFHITGGPNEDVVSATLEATGIAAENVTINTANGGSVSASTGSASLDAITITFADGKAPKATDLQLWFNVLPGPYSGLKLTINTTTKQAVLNSNKQLTYTAGKLNKAVLSSLTWSDRANVYTKVTSEPSDWSGTYLIVFEGATVNSVDVPPVAFNGSIDDLTGANNGTSVTISGNTITGNSTIDAAVFEIAAVTGGYSIQAVGNTDYIGNASDSNNITASSDALVNTISLNGDNSVNIISSGGAYLRYNATSGQYRFRYYKSSSYTGQKPIYLYLLEGSGTTDTRDDVTLSFSPATPNAITLGDSFTEPTLTVDPVAAASSVTYTVSSEPANCATIGATTGELTISAAGVITVTASIPQNDPDFKPASASYTLTVNSPAGHGTSASDPFTVAEAITEIQKLVNNTNSESEYYVSGIVSKVDSYNSQYHSITYNISDDGTTTGQLKVYGGLAQEGSEFSSKDDLTVGDQVVIKGFLYYYNGSTPEINLNSHIISLVPATKYTISLVQPSNGTISASKSQAAAGTTITLTATPSTGFVLDSWSVTNASTSADITVTSNSFTMPAANVNVTATFTAVAAGAALPFEDDMSWANSGASDSNTNIASTISTESNSNGLYTSATGSVYKGIGGLKLGSGSANGSITTKALNLTGAFHIVIEGAAWTNDNNNIVVSIDGTDVINEAFSSLHYVNIAAGTYTSSSMVTIGTNNKRGRIYSVTIASGEYTPPTPSPVINVTTSTPIAVANTASSQTIEYTISNPTSATLSASTTASWISNINYATSGQVTFDVAAQSTDAPARSGVITLSYTDAADVEVTVNQAAGPSSGGGDTEADKTYTVTFTSSTEPNNSSYTGSYTVTIGTDTWTVAGFNNNNNGWSGLIKGGRKNNTSTGSITSGFAMPYTIKTVKVTYGACKTDKITSAKLIIASNSDFTENKTETNITVTANSTETYTIASPAKNMYYKIEFEFASCSNNGEAVSISKVEYSNN